DLGSLPYGTVYNGVKFADGNWRAIYSPTAFPIGSWVHMIAVYQRGQRMELWQNGQLVASMTPPNLDLWTSANTSQLGACLNGSPQYLQGAESEVRIYN